ncbi:MAG: hypothetical protein ACKPDM_26930, partial [Dolichospermum sp.]
PNIQDDIDDSTDNLAGETTRYLNHVESKLYQDIQARKRIDSGLLFIACQFSSCSLSWLLFNLQVTLSIIQLASFCVSCLPGLIDVGDSFQFSINSESWEFSLGEKPIINSLKPLWLIGNQGSGKTYTASSIALIRKYCLDARVEYLLDRHATGDNAEVWKYLQPKNIAEIEEDIASTMQDNIIFWGNRIKAKPNDKLQVIIDEFTNLRGLIGELADTWFKLSLTDTRKAKCYLLGITHNDTNSSFAEGTKDTRKAGMILIQKFSANGETPLPRVVIRYGLVDGDGNNLEDIEKTIPSWLHPQKIHDHFNGKPLDFDN